MPERFEVTPLELLWQPTDFFSKSTRIDSTGDAPFAVEVAAPTQTGNDFFFWSAVSRVTMNARGSRIASLNVPVRPPVPRPGLGAVTTQLRFRVFATSGALLQEVPVALRNDGDARVKPGDIAITDLMFDPAGRDLDGEGEFVDLTNLTSRALDLAGCKLSQRVFGRSGSVPAELVAFRRDMARQDFGSHCLLPAGATLRVLTRARRSEEGPTTVPGFDRRYHVGSANPVWNNTGDRAALANEFNTEVATFGYGSQAFTAPNQPAGPKPPQRPPAPKSVVFAAPLHILAQMGWVAVFQVEDGDDVAITTNERQLREDWLLRGEFQGGGVKLDPIEAHLLPSGAKILGGLFGRSVGPADGTDDGGPWALPGAPRGSLIGRMQGQRSFQVGESVRFTVTSNRPHMLELAINDWVDGYWNNSGSFLATVVIRR